MDNIKKIKTINIIEEFPFHQRKEACDYAVLLNALKKENENFFVIGEKKKYIVKQEIIQYENDNVKKKPVNRRRWNELEKAKLVYFRRIIGMTWAAIGKRLQRIPFTCHNKYNEIYESDIEEYIDLYKKNFGTEKLPKVKKEIVLKEKKESLRVLPVFTEIEKTYIVGLKEHKIKSTFWNQLLKRTDANEIDFKQLYSKMKKEEIQKRLKLFDLMKKNDESIQELFIELSSLNYGNWNAEQITKLVYFRTVEKLTFREIASILNKSSAACQKKWEHMTNEQKEYFKRKGIEKYSVK